MSEIYLPFGRWFWGRQRALGAANFKRLSQALCQKFTCPLGGGFGDVSAPWVPPILPQFGGRVQSRHYPEITPPRPSRIGVEKFII
jgi:hypothetical protein